MQFIIKFVSKYMRFSVYTTRAINVIILMSFSHFINTNIMIIINELAIKKANLYDKDGLITNTYGVLITNVFLTPIFNLLNL